MSICRFISLTIRSVLCKSNIIYFTYIEQKQCWLVVTVPQIIEAILNSQWLDFKWTRQLLCQYCLFTVDEMAPDWLPYIPSIICQSTVWLEGVLRTLVGFSLWWRGFSVSSKAPFFDLFGLSRWRKKEELTSSLKEIPMTASYLWVRSCDNIVIGETEQVPTAICKLFRFCW